MIVHRLPRLSQEPGIVESILAETPVIQEAPTAFFPGEGGGGDSYYPTGGSTSTANWFKALPTAAAMALVAAGQYARASNPLNQQIAALQQQQALAHLQSQTAWAQLGTVFANPAILIGGGALLLFVLLMGGRR